MTSLPTKYQQTHERILDIASREVRVYGTVGMSVVQVMKAAGRTPGGFYAHFADRDALLAEAIELAYAQSRISMDAAIARRRQCGSSAFKALVECYLSMEHRNGCATGCPIAALGTEMSRQSEAVLAVTQRCLGGFAEWVLTHVPPHVPEDQVPLLCAALIGALQIARGLSDPRQAASYLDLCKGALMSQYEPRHQPSSAGAL